MPEKGADHFENLALLGGWQFFDMLEAPYEAGRAGSIVSARSARLDQTIRPPSANETLMENPSNKRIDWLTDYCLRRITDSADGCSPLYRDPADSRPWEPSYRKRETQGGGNPRLVVIDASITTKWYGLV